MKCGYWLGIGWAVFAAACAGPAHAADERTVADAADAEPPVVAEAELAERRGGLRVGGLDVEIGLLVRDSAEGREVLSSELWWTRPGEGGERVRVVPSAGGGETRFRHELGADGVRLIIENTASGLAIERSATLQIRVSNFTQVMGNAAQRAGRSAAERLSTAALRP